MLDQFGMLSVMDQTSPNGGQDGPTSTFYAHSSAQRTNTDALLASSIRTAHPGLGLTIVPQFSVNLLAYAQGTDRASSQPIVDDSDPLTIPLIWKTYIPPDQRPLSQDGFLQSELKFGKFSYSYSGQEYVLYVVDCRDGDSGYPSFVNQYLVHGNNLEAQSTIDNLLREAGQWSTTLHDEIWVFDQGWWNKDAGLYNSIQKSRWEDVILAEDEKKSLREDVKRFFEGQERYNRYRIAWKRGIIYYGPPGNGKTVSIKALSHELYSRPNPIPTLYVKSLASYQGPEYSVQQIFGKARAEAPCLLIFEDLDSLITDQVRSYFLNEVDGLNTNNGVYMIGSTNYLERLDPGISKRPSRFDRKFNFPKPNEEERIAYCEYWRLKLDRNSSDEDSTFDEVEVVDLEKEEGEEEESEDEDLIHITSSDLDLEFPPELSPEIAKITDGFSFAYLQEAFVATLLNIASLHDDDVNDDDDDEDEMELPRMKMIKKKKDGGKKDPFADLLFWRVIKKQIELLKEQI